MGVVYVKRQFKQLSLVLFDGLVMLLTDMHISGHSLDFVSVIHSIIFKLQADSKSSKGTKASKGSPSYSSSYSMSYSPPSNTPVASGRVTPPPTPIPTRADPSVFNRPEETTPPPTPIPTPTCCNPAFLEKTILTNVYNGDESIFNPNGRAMEWLKEDACNCGQFCTTIELTQRYILAVLYFSTDGPNWTNCGDKQSEEECQVQSAYGKEKGKGSNWLTCNSECEWGGTNCKRNGKLNVTDVENNRLDGILPAEMAELSDLTVLALEQNQLRGAIPTQYSNLGKLGVLDLDFNDLTGPLFDLSEMKRLVQLDLNSNKLSGSIEGLGWEDTRLKFIDLSSNSFTGTVASEIGDLTTLREFHYCRRA